MHMWHTMTDSILLKRYWVREGDALLRHGVSLKVICKKSKKEGKDLESIQSRATPDSGHHMGK